MRWWDWGCFQNRIKKLWRNSRTHREQAFLDACFLRPQSAHFVIGYNLFLVPSPDLRVVVNANIYDCRPLLQDTTG